MRRRRFVASGATVLAGLAGCLGTDPGESDGAVEPSREVDWEPTAASANDRESGDGGGATTGGNDAKEEPNGGNGGDGDGGPSSGKDEADEKRTANEAFDEGATWEADEAQVAADAREAGAAVEFELETTPPDPCGRTCRELRAALTNAGTGDAHDVVVETELSSGERVELGTIEALRVKRNGTLTVEHVVTSAERREVFRERIEP